MSPKKFGRSGAFKRKQKKIVKQLIQKFPTDSYVGNDVHVDTSANQSENDVIVNDEESQQISNEHVEERQLSADCDGNNLSNEAYIVDINIPKSKECKKTREFPFNETQFKSVLANWAVNSRIKHEQLRGLLQIWNQYVPLPSLPIDPRTGTLLETPQSVTIKDDNYWHRGLNITLQKLLGKCSNVPDELSLKVNVES